MSVESQARSALQRSAYAIILGVRFLTEASCRLVFEPLGDDLLVGRDVNLPQWSISGGREFIYTDRRRHLYLSLRRHANSPGMPRG